MVNVKALVDLLRAAPPPALERVDITGVQELTPATAREMRWGDSCWEQSLDRHITATAVRTFTWRRNRKR
jgi:hypothetical protein